MEENISINDLCDFLRRQGKLFSLVFLAVFASGVLYAITRPTLYSSSISLKIGGTQYFSPIVRPIESTEELAYRYSGRAAIVPIRNTLFVEVSVTSTSARLSTEEVEKISSEIIESHAKILQARKESFIGLINSMQSTTSKLEVFKLIDDASIASATRALGETRHQTLNYSGLLSKLLAGSAFAAFIIAFITVLLKELFERKKRAVT